MTADRPTDAAARCYVKRSITAAQAWLELAADVDRQYRSGAMTNDQRRVIDSKIRADLWRAPSLETPSARCYADVGAYGPPLLPGGGYWVAVHVGPSIAGIDPRDRIEFADLDGVITWDHVAAAA